MYVVYFLLSILVKGIAKLYVAGDTCAVVESTYGITAAQFIAWNPAVSSDCTNGFWADEAYCVSIS